MQQSGTLPSLDALSAATPSLCNFAPREKLLGGARRVLVSGAVHICRDIAANVPNILPVEVTK
jgi:hypothetical protein